VSEFTVYFIRHGDAEQNAQGGDSNRSLCRRGRELTRDVAKLLSKHAQLIDRIYCSPLVRAVQTSEILVQHLGCDDAVEIQPLIAFPPSLASVLDLADQCPTDTSGLAIVGHEPTLSGVVSHLLSISTPGQEAQAAAWRGFYPSQVVAFDYDRTNRSWTFKWQILPDGPQLINSIQ
jgi:phosphohistidine phosphatase